MQNSMPATYGDYAFVFLFLIKYDLDISFNFIIDLILIIMSYWEDNVKTGGRRRDVSAANEIDLLPV